VATQVFADEELARLREFPEVSRGELFRFFTLTPADVAFVAPVRGRGPADRLGLSVVLCTVPWLGFVPDKVAAAPPVVVERLADQLKVDASLIRSYGKRAQTRTEHLRLAAQYLGWRPAGAMELKDLDEFLLARAMEHDSPTLLFRLGCEYLISARVIRPSPDTVVGRVVHAREQAQRETYDRLAHELTPQRCAELDGLLVTDASIPDVPVAVVVHRPGGGVRGCGEKRGREAGVRTEPGRGHPRSVGAPGGAPPIPLHPGPPPDSAGAGTS
jgi:hypothetical protein